MKGFNLYWGAAAALVFFLAIGFISAHFLHLEGQQFMFFMMLMSALGISASAFFVFFQNKAQQKAQAREQAAAGGAAGGSPAAGQGGSPEIDQLIRDADQKLAASKASGSTIGNLPLIFVIGDQGATKTSVIVHSGLDPELLAGQVYQDNNVVSTASGNVWFARNSIFVEAGGRLLAKPDSWTRLVTKIQPGKLKSVMSKGEQAPRAVVLCFDCEAFARAGAAEQVSATGRYLQARLGEISQLLGISFPVYVLFTKIDRIAFFGDYVRNLSNEEATQVFGVTLPLRQPSQSGIYAEEENRRLTQAFNELFYSLCDRRIDYLPREHDVEKIPGAYEFPREFRKIRSSLVQLLVDICRPSQLRASPFLRGFYFSGVRPVVVNDVAMAPVRAAVGQQKTFDAGATRMFRAGMDLPQAVVAPQGSNSRRVPQWLFISHLLGDLILQDRAAMGTSGSSVKISGMRRSLLALASLALLFCTGMFSCSWMKNRDVQKDATRYARELANEKVMGANLPTLASLQKLENLRGILLDLSKWNKDGPPFMYRWFLYSGDDLLEPVRAAYYRSFRDILFGQVQGGWVNFLQNVKIPPAEGDDYGYGYNTLKGYLLTTSEYKRTSDKAHQDFLAELLATRWSAGREGRIDKQMSSLAKTQFDFYAHDLPNQNPYPDQAQADTVRHARDYLSRFTASDRIYESLLSDASRKSGTIVFNRDYPGSERIIRNVYPVPAGYTKGAWPYMNQFIGEAEKRFGGETWVLGDAVTPAVSDWNATKKQLMDKYVNEYITQWRRFVKSSVFNGYTSIDDANAKLQIIDANDSPLLRLFQVISVNTSVEPRIKAVFDAAPRVVPPDSPGLTDRVPGYMTSLNGLQQAVGAAVGKPLDQGTSGAIMQAANTATTQWFQVTNPFQPDPGPSPPAEHVDKQLAKLLKDPIEEAAKKGAIDAVGPVNAAGLQFCKAYPSGKFPFNPKATDEATLQEVNQIFRPKEGSLWTFYESTLKPLLTCTAAGCTPTGTGNINPAFKNFISQAMRFSRAVYGESGTDPVLKYSIQPRSPLVTTFNISVDGTASQLKSGQTAQATWSGASNSFELYTTNVDGTGISRQQYTGLWAAFHFLYDADSVNAGSTFVFQPRIGKSERPLTVNGQPLRYEIAVDTHGPPIFDRGFWQQLHCVSTVATK